MDLTWLYILVIGISIIVATHVLVKVLQKKRKPKLIQEIEAKWGGRESVQARSNGRWTPGAPKKVNIEREHVPYLPYDDIFKNQHSIINEILKFSKNDWLMVIQSLEEYLLMITGLSTRAENTKNVQTADTKINPRIDPISDASSKVAALKRFQNEGLANFKNLPGYYGMEIEKISMSYR